MTEDNKQFGRYLILKLLGNGATSDVYQARDTKLDRQVAIKILKPTLVSDQTSFERFTREAQAASKLFHDHIATVLDMGEIEGRYYIAMKYVDGISLDKYLKTIGALTWEQLQKLAKQVGSAIAYAHNQGYLHRDIKPNNIMVTLKKDFVLTDFGLTRAMQESGLTSTFGAVMGTPPYIPPEIWNGKPASPLSDQYSFACVLHEAITGKVLFSGDTAQEIITKHLVNKPEIGNYSSSIPPNVKYIIQMALSKDGKDRFAGMDAFVKTLENPKEFNVEEYLNSLELSNQSEKDKQKLNEIKAKKKRKSCAIAVLVSLILVVIACGMGYLSFKDRIPANILALMGKTEETTALTGSTATSENISQSTNPTISIEKIPDVTTAPMTNTLTDSPQSIAIVTNSPQPTATMTKPLQPTRTKTNTPQFTNTKANTPTSTKTKTQTRTFTPTEEVKEDTFWTGEYFANKEFKLPVTYTRQDEEIAFDWGEANPAPDIPINDFSVTWTKCMEFEERYYLFSVQADDEIWVYIDDYELMNADYWDGSIEQRYYVSAGTHCIKVWYKESSSAANVYFDFQPLEKPEPASGENTWTGEYFANKEFKLPVTYTRQDEQIAFDWGGANPAPDIPINDFSVIWTKCMEFEERNYLFTVQADDEIWVYIDDYQLMYADKWDGSIEQKYYVSAGTHCIKVWYKESSSAANVYFDFQPLEKPEPASGENTWTGEYFANKEFKLPVTYTRQDEQIAFDWGEANPAPDIPINDFSVIWTKCMEFEERNYIFTVQADDEIWVYIDDYKLMYADKWDGSIEQNYNVSAGTHCLKVRYKESSSGASVYFSFTPQN